MRRLERGDDRDRTDHGKASGAVKGLSITTGDAHALDWGDECFDLVVALGVIPYLHSPTAALHVSDEERRRLADAESRPAQDPGDDRVDVRRGALEDGVVLVPAEPVDRLLKATWEA